MQSRDVGVRGREFADNLRRPSSRRRDRRAAAPRRAGERRRRRRRAIFSARTRLNRMSISARSRTEVGSSSRMTRWPAACSSSVNALASSTICRAAKLELVRARARVDIDLDLLELPRRGGVERRPLNEAEPRELPLVAEIDVFADRQVGEQGLLLEHHADPLPVGVRGAFDAGFFSGNENLVRRPADRRRSGSS